MTTVDQRRRDLRRDQPRRRRGHQHRQRRRGHHGDADDRADDDRSAGGTATFTVVLTSAPTGDVTINLSSSDPTEGTVAGEPHLYRAPTAAWRRRSPSPASTMRWSTATSPTRLRPRSTSGDAIYAAINPADVAVTNTDNDAAGITVTPTTGLMTTEARRHGDLHGGADERADGDVTIALSSSDPTEGTVARRASPLPRPTGSVAQTVTVTGVDDALVDGDVAYTICDHGDQRRPDLRRRSIAADVAVTNTDNDAAGITVTPTTGLVTTEARGTATFTVVLTSAADGGRDDRPELERPDRRHGRRRASPLRPPTGSVAQTVTVTGVDDALVDGDVAYTIVTAVDQRRRDLRRRSTPPTSRSPTPTTTPRASPSRRRPGW